MGERAAIGQSRDAAFELLIAPYFAALFRRAYRLTGNTTEAEDLVQEVCIRAHASIDELSGMNNPTGWLFTVLYHLFVDFRRRDQSWRLRSIDGMESDVAAPALASTEPGPSEQTETELLHRQLRRALGVLSPEEQVLLVLREVEGYSLTEIGVIVELPISTLRSRLHRAREKLGRLIRNMDSETENTRGFDDELRRRRSSAG